MTNGGFFGGDPEKDTHLLMGDRREPGQIWTTPQDGQELIRQHAKEVAKAARTRERWQRIKDMPGKLLRRLQRQ